MLPVLKTSTPPPPLEGAVATDRCFGLLVAAGSSVRFGRDKLWETLDGVPVWRKAFDALLASLRIDSVGIVVPAERIAEFRAIAPEAGFVVAGGSTRTESVMRGLAAIPDAFTHVAIHDAARPFATATMIDRVVDAAFESGAAFPAISVSDTLRIREGETWVDVDRDRVVRVQTPQVARRDWLQSAIAGTSATDDVRLLLNAGYPVRSVEGDPGNVKITVVDDLPRETEFRTGLGYDIHRFSTDPNRPLWLGGIEFDERPGLEGHSDADPLIHAVVDAILGAAAEGDIGTHYPPSDPRWKNCASRRFLEESVELIRGKGWQIVNVDATVVAERPRILPRSGEIRKVLAESLKLDIARVSVKATTNEKLGALGKSEGIACYAVATIRR